MKLMKSVGKGCYCTSQNDVLVVQTALANIKNGSKAHYCGKLDGKDGPKTEVAIADFQCCNGIKATGKVESYGPTINKLLQKCPVSVKSRISGGVATPAAASNMDMQKVKQTASKTSDQIRKREPLPKVEAETLAKIVEKAAEVGVPLLYKKTDISTEGRFVAEFDIAPFAQIAQCGNGDHRTKMIQKVSHFIGRYATWQMGPSNTLVYKSIANWKILSNLQISQKETLTRLDVNSSPSSPTISKLLFAFKRSLDENSSDNDRKMLDQLLEKLMGSGMINVSDKPLSFVGAAQARYERNLDDMIDTWNSISDAERGAAASKGVFEAFDEFNETLLQDSLEAGKLVNDISNWDKIRIMAPVIVSEIAQDIVILLTARSAARGKEYSLNPKKFRIAPWGNRTGHKTGRWPHYHRKQVDSRKPGQGLPGQGIKRHRPWDKKPTDRSIWDRF